MKNEDAILSNTIEQEKFVLSAMLLKNGECIPAVLESLKPDDFYRRSHSKTFTAIVKIYLRGESPNVLTLMQDLTKSGDLENAGGIEFIYSLAEYAHTTAYVETYCKQIKEQSNRRKVIAEMERALQSLHDNSADITKTIVDAAAKLSNIANISDSKAPALTFFGSYFNHEAVGDVDTAAEYADRKTGFDNLDEHQIFAPGLYVIGAQPAAGKTTFVWQLAEQLARRGQETIYCSYEMSKLELFTKSVAREILYRHPDEDPFSLTTAAKIRRTRIKDQPAEVIDIMREFADSEIPLGVFEMHNETVDELLDRLRPLCLDKQHAPVIVLDYLQIMAAVEYDNRKDAVDDAVRKLKNFQRDTNATFIVVSSFNRANYLAQASFENFKESGGIEYGADVVWALQLNAINNLKDGADVSKRRQTIDDAKKQTPREIQLKCLKNRQGANYDCYFKYFAANDTFVPCEESELDDGESYDPPETTTAREENESAGSENSTSSTATDKFPSSKYYSGGGSGSKRKFSNLG